MDKQDLENEFYNDYAQALIVAGAKLIAFKTFGTYQGDWFAKIELDGKIGWIHDYYGSCSGCDAFKADVNLLDHTHEDGKYVSGIEAMKDSCILCQYNKQKMANFGKRYFDDILSFDEVLNIALKDISWDVDAQEAVDWIQNNK